MALMWRPCREYHTIRSNYFVCRQYSIHLLGFCRLYTVIIDNKFPTYSKVQISSWEIRRFTVFHYTDVIMTTMASQITSLTVVYSTVYSDADQRKHQSSASLAFVWGIHRDRWIPRTKGQLRGKCFHLMTSSCFHCFLNYWNQTRA